MLSFPALGQIFPCEFREREGAAKYERQKQKTQ